MKKVNKDFYTFLPKYLQRDLDKKIELYSEEEWFEEAWNKYREHCWEADKKHMESPNLFFGKLVKSNIKTNEEPIVLNDILMNEQKDKELNLELDEPFKMPEEKELEIEKESKEEHEEPV